MPDVRRETQLPRERGGMVPGGKAVFFFVVGCRVGKPAGAPAKCGRPFFLSFFAFSFPAFQAFPKPSFRFAFSFLLPVFNANRPVARKGSARRAVCAALVWQI